MAEKPKKILALNCGSSSVKYLLYDWDRTALISRGIVERIGIGGSFIVHEEPGKEVCRRQYECPDHKVAINLIIEILTDSHQGVLEDISSISAVGHRVVHGGDKFKQSVFITEEVLETIKLVQELAPLHNPPNIAGIEAAFQIMPGIPQIAVFDTAFHHTMPEYAYMYAVPHQWYEKYGLRRYGFHGTSHLYVSRRAAVLLGKKPQEVNLITMHIGNGVSITAVKKGLSVDTSMGFTPLEGAIMGTRSGDVDPAIIPFIEKKENISSQEIEDILNKKSGLLGITGRFTDRRDVIRAAEKGDERCQLAIEMECYRLKKYLGAYVAALGGVNAVVFTAGVGEASALIRAKTLAGLEFLGIKLDPEKNNAACDRQTEMIISTPDSKIKVLVIPTDEEIVFIEDVVAILENRYQVHTSFTYSFEKPDYKKG